MAIILESRALFFRWNQRMHNRSAYVCSQRFCSNQIPQSTCSCTCTYVCMYVLGKRSKGIIHPARETGGIGLVYRVHILRSLWSIEVLGWWDERGIYTWMDGIATIDWMVGLLAGWFPLLYFTTVGWMHDYVLMYLVHVYSIRCCTY